jgi:hypothetical protein
MICIMQKEHTPDRSIEMNSGIKHPKQINCWKDIISPENNFPNFE